MGLPIIGRSREKMLLPSKASFRGAKTFSKLISDRLHENLMIKGRGHAKPNDAYGRQLPL